MMENTSRRRVLYLIGTTSTIGFAGHSAASSHSDDEEEDHQNGESQNEEDNIDHDDDIDRGDNNRHNGGLNQADVHFLQMMIPHHEQATEMAELVPERTTRTELCDLAKEIIAVQDEEIEMMEAWLESEGHDPHAHDMDHGEMDGMLTEAEMNKLAAAEGDEFDQLFISGMIHHHEGAIQMAEDVLSDGENDEVAVLAKEVIEVQEAEINLMREWCRTWF